MKSPPGGGMLRLAEARQQRSREQERGADPRGELLVGLGVRDRVGLQAEPRSRRVQSTFTPSLSSSAT